MGNWLGRNTTEEGPPAAHKHRPLPKTIDGIPADWIEGDIAARQPNLEACAFEAMTVQRCLFLNDYDISRCKLEIVSLKQCCEHGFEGKSVHCGFPDVRAKKEAPALADRVGGWFKG